MLVDEHPATRRGVRDLLAEAPDIEVVGETGSGPEALAQIERLRPDVVILGCRMAEMDGPAIAAEVRRRHLPTHVLAFSAYDDEACVQGMLRAGVVGYLLKSEPLETIVQAVRAAAKGKSSFSAEVAANLAAWARGEGAAEQKFTGREHDVLRLLARGQSNEQIAKKLGISERTVRLHVRNIQDKSGTTNATYSLAYTIFYGRVANDDYADGSNGQWYAYCWSQQETNTNGALAKCRQFDHSWAAAFP